MKCAYYTHPEWISWAQHQESVVLSSSVILHAFSVLWRQFRERRGQPNQVPSSAFAGKPKLALKLETFQKQPRSYSKHHEKSRCGPIRRAMTAASEIKRTTPLTATVVPINVEAPCFNRFNC